MFKSADSRASGRLELAARAKGEGELWRYFRYVLAEPKGTPGAPVHLTLRLARAPQEAPDRWLVDGFGMHPDARHPEFRNSPGFYRREGDYPKRVLQRAFPRLLELLGLDGVDASFVFGALERTDLAGGLLTSGIRENVVYRADGELVGPGGPLAGVDREAARPGLVEGARGSRLRLAFVYHSGRIFPITGWISPPRLETIDDPMWPRSRSDLGLRP